MCSNELTRYPKSPFKFHAAIVKWLEEDFERIDDFYESSESIVLQSKIQELCAWMCKTPKCITYRVNTNMTTSQEVYNSINRQFEKLPSVQMFEIPEIIVVRSWDDCVKLDLEISEKQITVDAACGAAVLRGSHVFAPGVMSMPHGLCLGEKVSVFADLSGKCKKGAITYQDIEKSFVGNGVVQQNRRDLFDKGACPSGIAIEITATRSRLPQLGNSAIAAGHVILQNLPSIICSLILDPRPGERVLDMCAAPGNKTTHLSALMKNEGTLIALEKIQSKIPRLRSNCELCCCKNVSIFCYDSTKAVRDDEHRNEEDGKSLHEPPYDQESFDRILLDSPCSALGQRPQLLNKISPKELRSYVPLQRKLFTTAAKLLKVGGVLVYSTCTVTIAENEGIVAWALKNFSELELSPTRNFLDSFHIDDEFCGKAGYPINGLAQSYANNVLRFGPESETVGFFVARFIKKRVAM